MKCPNCSEEIEVSRYAPWGKKFRCPSCAAVLILPKKFRRLIILPLVALSIALLAGTIGVVLSGNNQDEFFSLRSEPVLGLVAYVSGVLFFILGVIAVAETKLQVVRLPRLCGNCGSSLLIDNAHFCIRCGADLKVILPKPTSRLRKTETSPTIVELPSENYVGICMVCKQYVKANDIVARCPHCGGLAHETDFLEYLHVHDRCPACGNHLDEKDLTEQPSYESSSMRTNKASETPATRKGSLRGDSMR
jgi:phage FluMu protein Com